MKIILVLLSVLFSINTLAETTTLNPKFSFRPRGEFTDDGGVDANDDGEEDLKPASSVTARTQLGLGIENLFASPKVSAFFEATHVAALGKEYNSTGEQHLRPEYEVVIDPPLTRMTQMYLQYKPLKALKLLVGRKALNFDDQRFIGSVAWRQMPQTFGVVEIEVTPTDKLSLQIDYAYERKGIKDELNGLYKKGTTFVNLNYQVNRQHKLTAFDYKIQNLHDTYGLRYKGYYKMFNWYLTYALQKIATLVEDEVTAARRDSYFYDVDFSVKWNAFKFLFNYHVLGEDVSETGFGFSTPFSTAHKFEGWSDVLIGKALAGDPKGLIDANTGIVYTHAKAGSVLLRYHKFDSVEDSLDYGSEIEFQYKYGVSKALALLLKAASYDPGSEKVVAPETVNKYWLMATYSL